MAVSRDGDSDSSVSIDTSSLSSNSEEGETTTRVISGVEFERCMREKCSSARPRRVPSRTARPPQRDNPATSAAYRKPRRQPPVKGKQTTRQNLLQRRHLPAHIAEEGSAERYRMELQQVSVCRRRLEKETNRLSKKLMSANVALQERQSQAEELLQAACSLNSTASEEKRKLLREHQTLKALKASLEIASTQLIARRHELEIAKSCARPESIKGLEENVRLLFNSAANLQSRIDAAEREEGIHESRTALSDAQTLLASRQEVALRAEERLEALNAKQFELEKEKETLAELLVAGQEQVEVLQGSLGEERRCLLNETASVPKGLQRLRAEVQTSEAQKNAVDMNLEGARKHYELSAMQLQASQTDTQSRLERWQVKREVQAKQLSALRGELTQLEQCLSDRAAERRGHEERLEGRLATSYAAERNSSLEATSSEREAMLSRLEEAKGELQSAQADAAERAKAQRAELEAAARGCEERQLALLANFTGKAPTLSPPVVDTQRIELLQQENQSLQQEILVLRHANRSQVPEVTVPETSAEPDESNNERPPSPRSEGSELSHRAESDVTLMMKGADQDCAESLCRGAGSIYPEGDMESEQAL